MRIGNNPEKENYKLIPENYHRVIIPVYIPNFDGYFKESFQVFKLCLESLLLTIHNKTRITIYNNNCHKDVEDYIKAKYEESIFIDQVFNSKVNMGKINAILSSVKGNLEPLITITDADVLFKNGWQQEVEKLFVSFPEAGMISPVPLNKALSIYNSNNWYFGFFKSKLKYREVIDPNAMYLFDLSLGNKDFVYNSDNYKKYLTIKSNINNDYAVMGCGHFVATLTRHIFDKGSNEPAFVKVSNGVESKFIDSPNENLGFLRLSTPNNLAYHMGNYIEGWMQLEFNKLNNELSETFINIQNLSFKPLKKRQIFIGKLLNKIIKNKSFKNYFLNKFQ